jgi:recombinational DNA repair ATPase RecF
VKIPTIWFESSTSQHLYNVLLEDIEVDLRATFDAADKYGLTGQGAAFEQFINKVNIRSTASEGQVRLLLVHVERACYTSLSLGNPMLLIIVVKLNKPLLA